MAVPFPETIVFDLDGTLIDTAPDLTAALNAALIAEGLAPVSASAVRQMVGRGARVLIERAMAASGALGNSKVASDVADRFIVHYGANIAVESKPFAGAIEAASRMARGGHRLGICTNKPEALSLKLMDVLNLRHLFPVILGADSRPYRKPDPRHLLDTIASLGGAPGNAVMIGDSDTDVKTARAANVPVIAVSFGYSQTPARDLGADAVIDRFDDLEHTLADLTPST